MRIPKHEVFTFLPSYECKNPFALESGIIVTHARLNTCRLPLLTRVCTRRARWFDTFWPIAPDLPRRNVSRAGHFFSPADGRIFMVSRLVVRSGTDCFLGRFSVLLVTVGTFLWENFLNWKLIRTARLVACLSRNSDISGSIPYRKVTSFLFWSVWKREEENFFIIHPQLLWIHFFKVLSIFFFLSVCQVRKIS